MITLRTFFSLVLLAGLVFWVWPESGQETAMTQTTGNGIPETRVSERKPGLPDGPDTDSPNPFATSVEEHLSPTSSNGLQYIDVAELQELEESTPLSPSLTPDEYRDYLRTRVSDEALAHPVLDQYLNHSLGYVQSFPDWLLEQEPLPLSAEELDDLSDELKTLGITEDNLRETRNLQAALTLAEAESGNESDGFQARVEAYDRLLTELESQSADPLAVQEKLAQRVFSDEERGRALQYHRGLYQRPPEQESAGD